MPKVGFIGLGNMGMGMARNIAKAGWPIAVWNRSAGKARGRTGRERQRRGVARGGGRGGGSGRHDGGG